MRPHGTLLLRAALGVAIVVAATPCHAAAQSPANISATEWPTAVWGSAALGYAVATPYASATITAPGGGATDTGGGQSVLAYDLAAHANLWAIGAVASLSGSAGRSRVRHSELTLGLELGWFGR